MLTTRFYLSAVSDDDVAASTAANWLTLERSGTVAGEAWPTYADQKVGLMYTSDYGYGVLASSCARTTSIYDYDGAGCYDNDWLFLTVMNSYGEWTMTPSLTNQNYAFIIYKDGYIYADGYVSFKNHSTRPVFYLSTTSTYSYAGNGSKANPYRYYNLSLISFTIDGTTYYAEEGMTWQEWVDSPYNLASAYISSYEVKINNYKITLDGWDTCVGTSDTINNYDYVLGSSPC